MNIQRNMNILAEKIEKMFGKNIFRKIKTYLDNPLILTRAIFTALVFFIEA